MGDKRTVATVISEWRSGNSSSDYAQLASAINYYIATEVTPGEIQWAGDASFLPELLKRLDATTIKAAIEQLDSHFDKDTKIIDMLLASRQPSPASGAAPQPLSDDRLREILNDWCEDKDYSLADVRRDLALAAPAPGKREVEWVIVAEGEGAEVRLVFDADPHEEIHCFMCVCGKPWRECTTDGMREDVARFDDPDEWGFDEAGKPYSVAWRHETGTVKVFRVRAALEAAAAPPPCECRYGANGVLIFLCDKHRNEGFNCAPRAPQEEPTK